MRRAVRTVGWVGIVFCVATMTVSGAVLITHPRSEHDYLAYITTYGNYQGRPLAHMPSTPTLIAAGNRACTWLDNQPFALWRTDGSMSVGALYRRYHRAISPADAALPRAMVPGAWAYLCPGSLYLHRPHPIFHRQSD